MFVALYCWPECYKHICCLSWGIQPMSSCFTPISNIDYQTAQFAIIAHFHLAVCAWPKIHTRKYSRLPYRFVHAIAQYIAHPAIRLLYMPIQGGGSLPTSSFRNPFRLFQDVIAHTCIFTKLIHFSLINKLQIVGRWLERQILHKQVWNSNQ